MSSSRRWKYRIRHILQAIQKIEQYTAGMDRDALAVDSKTLDAVIRNFQVIGEASRRVPGRVKEAHPRLPWAHMERMRHVLVHDYDRVHVGIVWDTIQNDLPPLVPRLEELLQLEPE